MRGVPNVDCMQDRDFRIVAYEYYCLLIFTKKKSFQISAKKNETNTFLFPWN